MVKASILNHLDGTYSVFLGEEHILIQRVTKIVGMEPEDGYDGTQLYLYHNEEIICTEIVTDIERGWIFIRFEEDEDKRPVLPY